MKYEHKRANTNTIIIVPPTGGTNILDRNYGETLCAKGSDVFILEHLTDDNEHSLDLNIHQRFYERAQKAIGLTLKNINSSFVGILATSVGAIHAAIATHHFNRIQAAFLIVGGAPISEVIAFSDQDVLVQARKKRFETMSFTSQQAKIWPWSLLPMTPQSLGPIKKA